MHKRFLDTAYCLALYLYIFAGAALVPLHGDESTLIFMGRDFYYFLNGQSVALQDNSNLDGQAITQQELRLLNGSVAKYGFGAVAYIQGYSIEAINEQWSWGSGWQWNHENGHVSPANLLWGARLLSSSFLAISAVALFGIGYQLNGRIIAYLASLIFTLNPAVLLNGRRAMMEGSMLAFTVLAVLVALYLLKNRQWWLFALLGVFSGFAVASKHTAIVTVAAIFLALGVYFVYKKLGFRAIASLALAGLLSLGVFYTLNPAWWNNPLGAARTVLELRQKLLSEQVSFFGGYANFWEQASGFTRQAFVEKPMYSEVNIDGFLTEQADLIQRYEGSRLAGIPLGLFYAIFSLVGMYALWQKYTASAWLIAIWALAMLILTFLSPLEWQRYYLPIYPVTSLLTALGMSFGFKQMPQKSA